MNTQQISNRIPHSINLNNYTPISAAVGCAVATFGFLTQNVCIFIKLIGSGFMDKNKKNILYSINKNLESKVSEFFIIGSFFKDDWKPENSDIDIVCVDISFEEYSYFENKKYVKNILSNLPYEFDIFIYTPNQFTNKIKNDLKFYNQISEGVSF